ncbi:MAG: DUF4159 domain-containing protein [Pseudomonadota bacterium]
MMLAVLSTSSKADPASTTIPAAPAADAEFVFARVAFTTNQLRGGNRRSSLWRTDYPDAEHHFLGGVRRLTRVDADPDGHVLTLSSDEVFDYPWLYAVEVGGWHLDLDEARRLREYLLRGGFLMVDDFHGSLEWSGFMSTLSRVFPDRPVRDIPDDDPVLHVFYDLDQRIQIPGIMPLRSGRTWEQDGFEPHWRGVYDDDGRLMLAINFNMDMGDAWEHADWPEYPEPMTALAYRFGINYLLYAMTH